MRTHLTRGARHPMMAIAIPCLALLTFCAKPGDDRRLVLEQVAAVALPEDFPPSGAGVGDNGDVIVWSAARSDLLLVDSKEAVTYLRFGSNEPPTAATFVGPRGDVEVLIGVTGRVATLRRDGTLVGERILMDWIDSGKVYTAARSRSGWVVAIGDSMGRTVVVQEDNGRHPASIIARFSDSEHTQRLPDSLLRRAVHLTATEGGVLISQWWPPFPSVLVSPQGKRLSTLRPASDAYALGIDSLDRRRAQVAMPALPLDRWFVQTLSDLRGDGRDLVLFDPDGNEIRRTSLNVPLALVASAPRANLLVAFRRTDIMELVKYRWRWREGTR